MNRIAKGTIFSLNANYVAADFATRQVQAFSRSNPSISPVAGAPELCRAADRARRLTFGSKLTMVVCPCRKLNPSVSVNLRTECCGSTTVTVVA